MQLSEADRRQIDAHGIGSDTARRQIELLTSEPPCIRLDRPCTVGDGIRRLSAGEQERLARHYVSVGGDRNPAKFVPASGAASRMFKGLLAYRERASATPDGSKILEGKDDPDVRETQAFAESLRDFAFYEDLQRSLSRRGQDAGSLLAQGKLDEIIGCLLDDDGMGYAGLPKALLKFHGRGGEARTALEEHLVEAAEYARGSDGVCRSHFTVSPHHRDGVERLLQARLASYRESYGAEYDVTLSTQKPSTDAVAVDASGKLFHLDDGEVLFRPAGHGALIENLNDLEAGVVFVKNIDNVVPAPLNEITFAWKRTLAGLLLELQATTFELLDALTGPDVPRAVEAEALAFLTGHLGVGLPAASTADAGLAKDRLIDRLDRPLRVCGMVRNTGEPGGGPFWVRDGEGDISVQIVESSQVDPGSERQQEIFGSSTHFNPVDLVCAVRDRNGRAYDLTEFVDSRAVFIVEKSHAGRYLRSLELPGLWNGAMAGWNTVFVEVPIETFNPVKQVLDLLRPAHNPR